MTVEKYFYRTPLGPLLLKIADDLLQEASFLDEDKMEINDASHEKSQLLLNIIESLDKYFTGDDLSLLFPVKQTGTEFQQKVWQQLLTIKPGLTKSYLDLSKSLGNPKAIRAVGAANGKNKIALFVPCHRVIGSNGNLIGYASGVWRKSWLLQHEAKFSGSNKYLF